MMSIKRRALLAIFFLAFAGKLHAVDFFKPFEGKQAPSLGKQVLVPEHYRVISAEERTLEQFLSGLSSDPSKALLFSLPKPDGTQMDFYVWKSTMMEDALQQKYMGIQTFTAEAKGNRNITAKID